MLTFNFESNLAGSNLQNEIKWVIWMILEINTLFVQENLNGWFCGIEMADIIDNNSWISTQYSIKDFEVFNQKTQTNISHHIQF